MFFRGLKQTNRVTPYVTPELQILNKLNKNSILDVKLVRPERLELSRVLPHSDLNAARLPFRHGRTVDGIVALALGCRDVKRKLT